MTTQNKNRVLFVFLVAAAFIAIYTLARNAEPENIAPLSNLQLEFPGYVDGIYNAHGLGCGGGGGPCLKNDPINIIFDQAYRIDRLILFVGCNDDESMGGEVLDLSNGEERVLTTFSSVGCGEAIALPETTTDRIAIKMRDGGGSDRQISVTELEVYGR